jgi:hypothetical protein
MLPPITPEGATRAMIMEDTIAVIREPRKPKMKYARSQGIATRSIHMPQGER